MEIFPEGSDNKAKHELEVTMVLKDANSMLKMWLNYVKRAFYFLNHKRLSQSQ